MRLIRKSLLMVSTVLCIFFAILWVESYSAGHELSYTRNGWVRLDVYSRSGRFEIGHIGPAKGYQGPGTHISHPGFRLERRPPDRLFEHTWEYFNFGFSNQQVVSYIPRKRPKGVLTAIMLPHWFLAAVFGSIPVSAFIRGPYRRYRRRRKGLCLKCGYDLTGNESGICPECGEHI